MILVLRKMGRGSQILHIIFISIFMLISLHSTHNLVVNALLNAVEHYNGQNIQQLQYLEDFKERKEKYLIEQVAGEDDDGEAKALIWEKFRALLGLDDLNGKNPAKINKGYGSPSPSPLPSIDAEAPAPAPMVPIHVHSHHPLHHSHPKKPLQKMHKDDKDKGGKRIMVAVLTSVGATFVLFSIGLICVCRIFRKQRKRSAITILTSRTGGRNRGGSLKMSSQNSGTKVSSNPGLDQFYLESIETALKPQAFSLKQNSEVVKISSVESTSICKLNEIEESEEAMKISDSQDIDSDGEIMSFRENAESVNNESDRFNSLAGSKLSDELHSSDNESFHSFCDSHSSSTKLSNASAEILSPKGFSPYSVTSPTNQIVESVSSSKTNSKMKLAAPPPPPPPPQSHISPSPSSSCSTPFKYKALSSSTLPLSSSPTNSNSSSGSNQTPQHELPPKPSGTIPGIPPPPCPPSQLTRLGKDGVPLPKLKPLHWDKVRAAPDRSMVWDNLRSNSFEFDEEMIESLFGYNLQSSLKSDEAKSKSKSPSPSKHLLEPKRVQNITILSKAVNVTAEQVCEALVQGEGLCLQQLEALAKMVPTNEEEVKLSNYKGGINGLSSAETFVKAILNIPFAFSRIEAMLYRETFEDEVVHLRKSFSMLEEACKELKSSRLFLKLLEAVLKTGNRMNIGTMRGGARAFKLDALLKLADVKGTDGRTTLLHFVVQEIVRSEGIRVSESIMGKINLKTKSSNVNEREENCRNMGLDLVSGLSIELCNVKKTATIDLDVLASSVSNLSDGMVKLKLLLGKELFSDEKSGNFVYSMRSFLVYAEKNIKELQEDEGRVLLRVREITEYFHGNVSKDEANPLRIFVIVRDFLGMLDHVCKELRSSKVPSSSSPLAPFR